MRARCAQRGGLGWAAQVSRFFVSKASCASQGGVGGLFICLRWRSAILRESSSLWQVSQTILLRGASDAHRHWFTHRPRAGVARTDIIRIWPSAPSKTSQNTATRRSPGSALTANSHPRNDERGLQEPTQSAHSAAIRKTRRCLHRRRPRGPRDARRRPNSAKSSTRRTLTPAIGRRRKTRRSSTSTGKWPSSNSSLE